MTQPPGSPDRAPTRPLASDPLLIAVCLAIVTLPLEVTGFLFPTTVINLSRIAMAAAMVVVAYRLAVRRERVVLPGLPLVLGVAAFLAVDLGSAILTRRPNALREIGPTLFYIAFAFCVAQALTDRRRVAVAGASLLAAAGIEALIVVASQVFEFYLSQVRDMGGRRNGTFVDPNITARFLIIGLVVALAAVRRDVGLRTWLGASLGALIAIALVLTYSRSGWILFVIVIVAAVALAARERRVWAVALVASAAFAVSLVVVPNALHRATDVPIQVSDAGATSLPAGRLASVSTALPASSATPALAAAPSTPLDWLLDHAPIDAARRYLARAAVAMFVDHPLVGVGLGGYQPEILGPYAAYIDPNYRSAPISLAHTDVLRVAAEEGIVGLAALACFLVGIAWAVRARRARAGTFEQAAVHAAALGALTVFIAAQTEGRFYNEPYLWLAVGVVVALGYHRLVPRTPPSQDVVRSDPTSSPG
jgi:putative inorganic carbon (HCO3(-)) transporter